MAEQHAVGGGQGQRVAGALLPGQVLRPGHELLRLDACELRKGAVRRFIAPNPLRGREHRVAAVAFLVVAVVLVAVDDDLVADLPALDLRAHRPDDARGIGAGHVERVLVSVNWRDRLTKRGPDTVVIDARGHHEHEHVVAVQLPRWDHLELHGVFGRSVPFLPDRPGVHLLGHVTERRNLADVVQILEFALGLRDFLQCRFAHDSSSFEPRRVV